MKYIRLNINTEFLNQKDKCINVLGLIRALQDKGFFNKDGLIQYEEEQKNDLKAIFDDFS